MSKKNGITKRRVNLWRGVCVKCGNDIGFANGDYEMLYRSKKELLSYAKDSGWKYDVKHNQLKCPECQRAEVPRDLQ